MNCPFFVLVVAVGLSQNKKIYLLNVPGEEAVKKLIKLIELSIN